MPRKYILRSATIRKRLKKLEDDYGQGILKVMSNLYFFCWQNSRGLDITLMQRNKDNKGLPFFRKGHRESNFVYLYLLSRILKMKNKYFWDDAIFIIYFTYYTGWSFDSVSDLNMAALQLCEKDKDFVLSSSEFEKQFRFIRNYNFSSRRTEHKDKIKKRLNDATYLFKKKYETNEKVQKFYRITLKNILQGLQVPETT